MEVFQVNPGLFCFINGQYHACSCRVGHHRNVSGRPFFKNYPIAAKSVIEDEAANEGNAAKG